MDSSSIDTLGFWAIAAAMTAVALAFVLPRLAARRRASAATSPAASNVAVFRSQIAELDRDLAAGALAEAEYRQAREDLERRLLDEAFDARGNAGPGRATPRAAVAIGIALPALAFALYALFGDPTALRSEANAVAPVDASAAANPEALRAKLVAHLERTPRDGRSWVLLARIDLEADRFGDAAAAYAQALAVSAKVARDPDVWCEYADALGMAQGGSLAGKPRELVAHALTLDATHAKGLEMAGSAAFEANDPAEAATYWRQLLAKLPARSPQRRELAVAVARAEELAAAGSATTVTAK